MIITLNWLKEFLDTSASTAQIEETLTNAGLEVELVLDRRTELSSFLVGKIIEARAHPNANKLQICKVQISEKEVLQIVCGAQNAREGILVVVAPIGTKINTSSIIIKEAEIRGVKSYGMLCSAGELSLNEEILPKQLSDGILEMPEEAQIGDNLTKYFDLNDVTFTCNITPNRGDCLSVYGIARELSANGLGTLKPITIPLIKENYSESISVLLEAEKCKVFSLWRIENITNVTTPSWIRYRLANVGIKSVNAPVDILNYVSHSFGQPMHAYDAATLADPLSVAYAKSEHNFLALDSKQYQLAEKDIVVNSGKCTISIGGIIGSWQTKVTDNTSEIVIESAVFEPASISNTGRRLRIQTDARYRFERHVDSQMCIIAAKIAAQMCADICGGKLVSSHIEESKKIQQRFIILNTCNVENFLGFKIKEEEILSILEKLGFLIVKIDDHYSVKIPSWRSDVNNENDLISEIIRIHGYTNVPLKSINQVYTKKAPTKEEALKTLLVQAGYTEVITWSFLSKTECNDFALHDNDIVALENPISEELSYLRQSIIPTLLEVTKKTQARSVNSAALFEIGPVFWGTKPDDEIETLALLKCGPLENINPYSKTQDADLSDLKGDLEYLLKYLGINPTKLHYCQQNIPKYCHPKKCTNIFFDGTKLGYIGQLHPILARDVKHKAIVAELYLNSFKMPKPSFESQYYCPSSYQQVRRDLAFLIDQNSQLGPILVAISNLRKDLIKKVNLFDIFQDGNIESGKKSFAIAYWMQAEDRTLTDAEITQIQQQIIALMSEKFDAKLRM